MSYNIIYKMNINFKELSYEAIHGDNNCYLDNQRTRSLEKFSAKEDKKVLDSLQEEYAIDRLTAFTFIIVSRLGNNKVENTVSEKIRVALRQVQEQLGETATSMDFMYGFKKSHDSILKVVETFNASYLKPLPKKEEGEWVVFSPSLNAYAKGKRTATRDRSRATVFKTVEAANNVAASYHDNEVIRVA